MFFDRKLEISFHPILLRRWFMLEEDRPLLQKLAKECKDAKECIRYLALHTVSEGYEGELDSDIPLISHLSTCG